MDEEASTGWELTTDALGQLSKLTPALWRLTRLAKSGADLIAIGEAVDAIEHLLEGEAIEVDVGISVGFRRGYDSYEEGLFACFRINDEEIVLDELNTSYSHDIGSDHSTRV